MIYLNIFVDILNWIKGIFTAVNNFFATIVNICKYIFQFFVELGHLIGYLVRGISTVNELIGTFPTFLILFATATLTVSVAYKILGREK